MCALLCLLPYVCKKMMIPSSTSLRLSLHCVWTSLSMCFFTRSPIEMKRLWTFVQDVWISQRQWVWSVYGACGKHIQAQTAGLYLFSKLDSNHWCRTSLVGPACRSCCECTTKCKNKLPNLGDWRLGATIWDITAKAEAQRVTCNKWFRKNLHPAKQWNLFMSRKTI